MTSIASQNRLRCASLFGSILEAQNLKKSMKFRVLQRLFFVYVSSCKFNDFRRARKLKNVGFSSGKTTFFVKSAVLQLGEFSIDFRYHNCSKIHKIWLPNAIVFLTSFSDRILMIFASNLEVQKPLNFEKIDAFGQRWWWTCSGSALGFDFGAISRRFGAKFDGFYVQMCGKS